MTAMIVTLTAREGAQDQVRALLAELEVASTPHAGRVVFRWFQHTTEPRRFTLVEQWESQAAVQAHIAGITPIWLRAVPLLEGEPEGVPVTAVTDAAAS